MTSGSKRKNQTSKVTSGQNGIESVLQKAKEQLKSVRRARATFKTLQYEVTSARQTRATLIARLESSQKDVIRTETVGLYIARKTEFYTIASRVFRAEIDEKNSPASNKSQNLLSVASATDANADLLAQIVVMTTVFLASFEQIYSELEKRRLVVQKYITNKMDLQSSKDVMVKEQSIQRKMYADLIENRDSLRRAMNNTDSHGMSIYSLLRRHDLRQECRYVERWIEFTLSLTAAKLKDFISAYSFWLISLRRENTVLYEETMAAWRWIPTGQTATGLRHLTHAVFRSRILPENEAVLEERITAVNMMVNWSGLRKANFAANVRAEYAELSSVFFSALSLNTELQMVQSPSGAT